MKADRRKTWMFVPLVALGLALVVALASFAGYYETTSLKLSGLQTTVSSLQSEALILNSTVESLEIQANGFQVQAHNLTAQINSLQIMVASQASLLSLSNKTVLLDSAKLALASHIRTTLVNFTAKYAGYIVAYSSYNTGDVFNVFMGVQNSYPGCVPTQDFPVFCVTTYEPSLVSGQPDLIPILPGQVVITLVNGDPNPINGTISIVYYS